MSDVGRPGSADVGPQRRRRASLAVLALLVLVCFATGFIGATATARSVSTWYVELTKPGWTPPGALFGPVWTTLYVCMALAAWLVWLRRGWGGARVAFGLFALQLVLNALWSVIFFGLRRPGVAAVEIVLLWTAILATLIVFARVSRPAGWLLVPYLAWVSFAGALNLAIWSLNA